MHRQIKLWWFRTWSMAKYVLLCLCLYSILRIVSWRHCFKVFVILDMQVSLLLTVLLYTGFIGWLVTWDKGSQMAGWISNSTSVALAHCYCCYSIVQVMIACKFSFVEIWPWLVRYLHFWFCVSKWFGVKVKKVNFPSYMGADLHIQHLVTKYRAA